MIRASSTCLVVALALAPRPAAAVAVERWSLSTADELARGELDGTAIDAEGSVRLAPEHELLWGPGEGIVWDVDAAADGSVFVGLSAPGRVVRAGVPKPEVWYAAEEEKMVTAVAADGKGGVYAGVTPGGIVLHGSAPERLAPVFETGASFVWALARGRDGRLWIGTGSPGALRSWRPGEEAPTTVFETGDDPVRCIVPLAGGGVAFGTGGEGKLVRVDDRGRAFVLWDADEEEIVALAEADDGALWALAATGPKQVTTASPALAEGASTSVRVVATAPGNGGEAHPQEPLGPTPAPRRLSAPPGGAAYRIASDGTWRRMWEANDETPFGLALDAKGRPIVATGDGGRLWELDPNGPSFAVARIESEQASALARGTDGRVYVGGTTDARVVGLGPRLRSLGSWLSPSIDAGGAASWGRVDWRASVPPGARLTVLARAGNTAKPDGTWSDWNELGRVVSDGGASPTLPATRFLQVRLDFVASPAGETPSVRVVEARWLPRNRPPAITGIGVDEPGAVWSVVPVPSPRATAPTVADDPVARRMAAEPGNSIHQQSVRKSWELGARTVWWTASDPDGDALAYAIELQPEGSDRWVSLARDVVDTFWTFDARTLPDGLYRMRVTARDARDNPADGALAGERTSAAFVVDNTRPAVGERRVERARSGYDVRFLASDPGGRVAVVEIAVDGEDWKLVTPEDGVADSEREPYEIRVEPTGDRGALALRVRVVDASGNVGGDIWSLER